MAPGIEPVLTSSSERTSITSTFSPLSSLAFSSSAFVSLAVADRCTGRHGERERRDGAHPRWLASWHLLIRSHETSLTARRKDDRA